MDAIADQCKNQQPNGCVGNALCGDDIAVIGFSFKLPQGVEDVDGFWDVLQNRENLMTPWPEDRLNAKSFVTEKKSKFNCQGGYFISGDPAAFDAPFFSISTKEAAALDPMQRWTLETSYRAFENAGIPAEKLKGSRTSVFSASFTDDWSRIVSRDPDNAERTAATGSASSLISNRVSWYFDLRGPSVHIDTACSSSLVAFDMACQSLRAGEASTALVTGSSLILTPDLTHYLSSLGFLSPDSKCWTFDHRANGYARGEGFTAIVLKPLSAALRDGDMIRAVVRATGSNQDGQTASLTQPCPRAQEELIRHVYQKANLSFDKTRYVEAHGTGTPVGDPIEMKAIGRVFRNSRSAGEPLYVGSLKTNIGHLEGSSGLAGVIKSIISLEKGVIPPHALFEKINPDIDLEFYNTAIPTMEVPWPGNDLRRISVNSFGFGGTNSHAVLDDAYNYLRERGLVGNHYTLASDGLQLQANELSLTTNGGETNGTTDKATTKANGTGKRTMSPKAVANGTAANGVTNGYANGHVNGVNDQLNGVNGHSNGVSKQLNGVNGHVKDKLRLLVWSAADAKALKRTVEQQQALFRDRIASNAAKLDQLAYTLASRRSHMLWRTSAIVPEAPSKSFVLTTSKPVRSISSGEAGLAFVFTGQGAQYADMGWDIIHQYPLFAQKLQQIDEIYKSFGCKWKLLDALRDSENINRPEYSQPLSTAVQLALVELLKSFGIVPKAVVGHSSGEIAAAYAIGALSLDSACRVSYFRGQLAGKLRVGASSPGAMISVNLAEDEVPAYLEKLGAASAGVSVACVNSPLNCTLSGPEIAIDCVKKQADKDSIFAQKLKTGVSYHSSAMLAIADDYKQKIGCLKAASSISSIRMVSTVTGKRVRASDLAKAQYWVDNMVSPVRFSEAVTTLAQQSSTLKPGSTGSITDLVEVGPTAALRRPVADTLAGAGSRSKEVRYSSVLYRRRHAVETTMELAGHLFSHGHPVSIAAVNQVEDKRPFLVDYPGYPFDHSQKYWAESRISRDYRLREAVRGETLGVRVSDWNPLQPRWRNFLSVETDPWVVDHNISDTVVYPAAGMLVMAIEAALQTVPTNRTIAGYFIKEARFMSPIVVGESREDRTETIVELRPVQESYEKDSARHEVRGFCYRNKEWTECFSARIQVEYEDEASHPDIQKEKKLLCEDILLRYEHAVEACARPVDSQVFYQNAADHGLKYGEWFKLLNEIHWDGKMTAVARIDVKKPQFQTTSLVHPAVLDAIIHMLRASSQAFASASATNVPVKIDNTWISAAGWQSPQTGSLRCLGTASGGRDSGEDGSIYVLSDDGNVLMSMGRIVSATVSRPDEASDPPKLLHKAQWKPQLSFLDPLQLTEVCTRTPVFKDEATMLARHQDLTSVMNLALTRTLRDMTVEERKRLPVSLQRHMEWIQRHVDTLIPAQIDDPDNPISDAELERRLQKIDDMHPSWKLHTDVVRELKNIIIGEKDPLEVLFESNLADVFYADMFAQICDARLVNFLELASHENPGLRILEVGAGTGGFTGHVIGTLQALEEKNGGLRFSEYTYTDISPAFFERAGERWKSLGSRISFKPLDLERTLESQGFEVGSYDLVVAGSVLHATTDLVHTMKNVRTALKPGGRALILEVVAPQDVVVNFSFGLAPGWWLAREEWRAMSPLLDEGQWDGCLRESGYSGNDLVLKDCEEEGCHISSIIVSTAVEEASGPVEVRGRIIVVVDESSATQVELANLVRSHAETLGGTHPVSILSLAEFQNTAPGPEDVVICLPSVDAPFMSNMSESKLAWLQHLMSHSKKLLWVSGSSVDDPQLPFYGQAQGVLRSVRLEAADSHIVSLAIESGEEASWPNSIAQHIINIINTSFFDAHPSKELEYVARNGLLETCRAAEDVEGNTALDALLKPQVQQKAWSDGPALSLSVKTAGTLDSICFAEDADYETELAAGKVEIEAKAWGVNFRDVMQALGRLDERTFGYECAGVVTRVGGGAGSLFQEGDRVCMVYPGCMRQYPRAPATSVIKMQDKMSFTTAASLPIPAMTAYHALADVAQVRKGETVLIHSAAGSTGQMAVAVAKARGAIVYATVSSQEKKDFLIQVLGVPEANIFQSRNTSFKQAVLRATSGRGVDVLLNSLSGDGLRASWECMARRGRFVEIGTVDITADSGLPMSGFAQNVSFSAVDLRDILLSDPEFTADLLQKTMQFVGETGAKPTPVHTFSAEEVEQAFRTVQSGRNIGRVVIEPRAEDIVSQYVLNRMPWKFDSGASYIIAGGLGGIGRAIMKWMADRGAKYIIVPSRSGVSSRAAVSALTELKDLGVQVVAPKCDVASEASVLAMLSDCASTMPPIKGCINAALVLQDAMFSNMNLAQWDLAVKAKVDTAWNLHRHLPKDLDFFILLSSLAGVVGQMATANYAGGCTFQDALARHRVEHGQKAVSIDIGWMRDIGIVAETAAFQRQRLATEDMQQIDGRELLAILERCCDPAAPPMTPEESQVFLGLRTPADFLAKGQSPPAILERPLFAAFSHVVGAAAQTKAGQTADPATIFRAAATEEEKTQVVITALVAKLARAMSMSPEDVELSKPLSSYGVDSLMAVELRNWMKRDFGAPLAVFDIMGGVPISAVGELVVAKSAGVGAS